MQTSCYGPQFKDGKLGLQICMSQLKTYLINLRLSNHTLNIETGCHNKIKKNERFCPFCPNLVEDEMHFLLFCPVYTALRGNLFQNLNIQQQNMPQEQTFLTLMTNLNIVHFTAKYLKMALYTREFLLKMFRNIL